MHSPTSSSDSNQSISSSWKKKIESIREIYEQHDHINERAHFAMFSIQPISFKEVVKEKKWVEAIIVEIESTEKNNAWRLLDLLADKTSFGVKWFKETKFNEKGNV